MDLTCNICGGVRFVEWRGRPGEQCQQCGALARHRIAMVVYQRHLFPLKGHPFPLKGHPFPLKAPHFPPKGPLFPPKGPLFPPEGPLFPPEGERGALRVLHLAPEPGLHPILSRKIGIGYTCADASPERYPHAECMRLYFPNDFGIFPDNYFDAILHNHVLEHIPGHFGDHLMAFTRLLKPGGRMIFSVPGPYMGQKTIEGGENLASDAERLEKFRQEDHYKLFGADFGTFIENMPGGHAVADGINDEIRAGLNVRPKKAPFFIWEKSL